MGEDLNSHHAEEVEEDIEAKDLLSSISLSDPEDEGRESCLSCLRPLTVCWCRHLPSPRINTTTKLVILQGSVEVPSG